MIGEFPSVEYAQIVFYHLKLAPSKDKSVLPKNLELMSLLSLRLRISPGARI